MCPISSLGYNICTILFPNNKNVNSQQLINVIIMNWCWSTTEGEKEKSIVQDDYPHVNFQLSVPHVLKVTNLRNWYDTVAHHQGYQCSYEIIAMKKRFYDAALVSDVFLCRLVDRWNAVPHFLLVFDTCWIAAIHPRKFGFSDAEHFFWKSDTFSLCCTLLVRHLDLCVFSLSSISTPSSL